jgi:transcriptional regulator with XRE-family HTH domain
MREGRKPVSALRVARIAAGVRQQDLAAAINRHRAFVWRLETGRGPARIDRMIVSEISRVLGCPAEQIFEEVPE